jgi:hypothetical protein
LGLGGFFLFRPGDSFLRPCFRVFFGAVFFFLAIVITPFLKHRSLFWESEALGGYTEKGDLLSTTVFLAPKRA